jgi:PAS domain S-box-containing protein
VRLAEHPDASRRRWLGSGPLGPVAACAAAVGLTVGTLLFRLALDSALGGQPTLVIFTVPIMLSAYLGGWGAGLVSTALSYLLASYFLLPPIFDFAVESTAERWQQFFIAVAGVVISILNEALHRARRQASVAIREQRQAGVVLQEAEARHALRLAGIVDSAMDAIVSIDSRQRIVLFNAAAERMFLCRASDALGQGLDRFIPEHSRAGHAAQVEGFGRTGATSRSMRSLGALMAQRSDGAEFPIEASISHIDVGGQKFYTVILRDVTDRQQADARMLAQLERLSLLDQITRAIGERQDLESVYQVTARSLEEQLPAAFACVLQQDPSTGVLTLGGIGLRSHAEMPGLVGEASIEFNPDRLARCLAGELIYDVDTADLPFPFARRMALAGLRSLVLAPLRAQGRVFGMLVVARREAHAFSSGECEFVRQLSAHVALAAHQARLHGELQAAFDELRRTQEGLMQQERLRALGQMASGIAHDINNAISPAVLYAESLLEQETLSDRARSQVQSIARAVDDVAATVARMREFYRARESREEFVAVALNDVARQVIELARARWSDIPQRRGTVIEVVTELADPLPPVQGAESEIREALINLIFNAVDAMPEGGKLTLRTRVIEGQGAVPVGAASLHRVALEVGDTGVGMDEGTRRRCLEPFFTTKGERGTGLGLAMVYGTAKRHDAELEIESAPGEGTLVRLAFPVPSVAVAARPVRADRPGEPLRLLLVDDDPVLLNALRNTLEVDGHSASIANGGQAGIDAFVAACDAARPYDVVITDLGMPRVDGRLVAAQVKQRLPATPVILLTGWGQRMAEEGDAPADVDVVLSKPPRLADLRAALAKCRQDR